MTTRRGFIAGVASLTAVGSARANSAKTTKNTVRNAGAIYTRLGVRPLINAIGTVTLVGGSIMPPEVTRAMEEASRNFVYLPDLQRQVGIRIAELLGVPAAMVTAGAASAITVGTASCMTRGDAGKLARLPDVTGMKSEVIQQKSHRGEYYQQILLTGAKIVEIESQEELNNAISDRTAMMFFLNKADGQGRIRRDEWLRIAKDRGIPAFNDAAADMPPPQHLSSYVKDGFDLVAFSGGKGLRGPQCSGLLLGSKDLIEAGRTAISPHQGIGRGMKVGKEEIVGLLAAVEHYLKSDHDAERHELDRRASYIINYLSNSRLRATLDVPEIANHVPHVHIDWDGKQTAAEAARQLLQGTPSIAVGERAERGLTVSVWMMRPGEHKIVAKRLAEVLA
jgi:uncharacterized pyridoxal phosphate-dependent enzyme